MDQRAAEKRGRRGTPAACASWRIKTESHAAGLGERLSTGTHGDGLNLNLASAHGGWSLSSSSSRGGGGGSRALSADDVVMRVLLGSGLWLGRTSDARFCRTVQRADGYTRRQALGVRTEAVWTGSLLTLWKGIWVESGGCRASEVRNMNSSRQDLG